MMRSFAAHLVKGNKKTRDDNRENLPKKPTKKQLEELLLKDLNESLDMWNEYVYEQLANMPNMPSWIEWGRVSDVDFEDFELETQELGLDERSPGDFPFVYRVKVRATLEFEGASVRADNSGPDWSVQGTLRARGVKFEYDSWDEPELFGIDPSQWQV